MHWRNRWRQSWAVVLVIVAGALFVLDAIGYIETVGTLWVSGNQHWSVRLLGQALTWPHLNTVLLVACLALLSWQLVIDRRRPATPVRAPVQDDTNLLLEWKHSFLKRNWGKPDAPSPIQSRFGVRFEIRPETQGHSCLIVVKNEGNATIQNQRAELTYFEAPIKFLNLPRPLLEMHASLHPRSTEIPDASTPYS